MTHEPVTIVGADRPSRFVVVCDHATNLVPAEINGGSLGLPPEDMERHIAYDVGALGVATELAQALDAPLAASRFSRLVIDPNRGEDDPTLVMRLYDGSIIPANRHVDEAEIRRRLDAYYRPYHAALSQLLDRRDDPILVSIHSFTPQLRNRPKRPWHVGLLYSADTRLAHPLLARLRREPGLVVGDNEPYSGHLPGDTIDRHGLQRGIPHVLIELRNDLIRAPGDQRAWGKRLAPMLGEAAEDARL